jgi:hypothetical protein
MKKDLASTLSITETAGPLISVQKITRYWQIVFRDGLSHGDSVDLDPRTYCQETAYNLQDMFLPF